MKLIGIILTITILHTSASAFSQINIVVKNSTIGNVLKKIEEQSGYSLFYDSKYRSMANPISLDLHNASIEESLNKCFENQPFTYQILAKTIVITPIPSLIKQDLVIKGKVIDEKGQPLAGATVRLKGSSLATYTDAEGNFIMKNIVPGSVLTISFTGFVSQEIPIGNAAALRIVLKENQQVLNQLVVVGYGTVAKPDLTGSVGVVNISDMSKAPVSSFAEALAGRVAGVVVAANDGQPGGEINITVRGAGSLTQSTAPLYVIDGFPVEDPNPATLNPEEIASITILKDASSTAIYGSRGANGVILIQTKRGKVGRAAVSYNTSIGYQMTPKVMELMSPYEFVKYQLELNPATISTNAYLANGKTLEDYKNEQGLNLQDYALRTGQVQIHNLALRGGTDHTKYSVSGSAYNQKGTIINTGLKRYNGRVTLDQEVSDKVKTGVTVNYSDVTQFGQVVNQGAINSTNPTNFVLSRIWMYRPVGQPFLADQDVQDGITDENVISPADYRVNPLADLENQHQFRRTSLFEANGYLSYGISKDLTFKTTAGVRLNRLGTENFYNSKTAQGDPKNVSNVNGINGQLTNTSQNSFTNSNSLTYKKTINKDHTITGLGLFEIFTYKSATNGYSGRLLPNENLGMDGLEEGIIFNAISNSSKNGMVSYATRWDYNYKSKYILTMTFRADGSSKFKNQWGYFPGAALAWNMQNESFFANVLPGISTSKIRVSYGSNGNNRVGDFDTYPRLFQSIDGYSMNNQPPIGAIHVSSIGNPDLQWEKVNIMDLGYEVGIWKNRVSMEIDLYRKTTENLLLSALLPTSSGFGSAIKNIGKLRNEGMEISLHTNNISTKSFNWESNFNISFNKNTVMELTRGQIGLSSRVNFASGFNRPLYLASIGKPAGMMIGYLWDGNYQYDDFDNPSPGVYILKPSIPTNGGLRSAIQPGDIKYKDINGDGIMNDGDVTYIGRGQPIHTGGFSNNFIYKGLSLNVFFQWSYGNDIFNANRLLLEGNSNGFGYTNQFASYADRWSPTNPTNNNYRTRGQGPLGDFSSRVVEDGSFLRLKTMSLNYAIPASFTKKVYLSSLNVNITAQNLYTWTNYSGLDPEVSTRNVVLSPGYDFSAYPQARTIVIGLNATF